MYVDCHSCPGRPLACDGCVMQLLFEAPISTNGGVEGGGTVAVSGDANDAELRAAIEVFEAAALISTTAAVSARSGITSDQKDESRPILRVLRAG